MDEIREARFQAYERWVYEALGEVVETARVGEDNLLDFPDRPLRRGTGAVSGAPTSPADAPLRIVPQQSGTADA